jgi:hypothetical protein
MVISPDILSEVAGQFLPGNTSFRCELPFEIAPEPLKSVDMVPFSIAVNTLIMVDQTVDITLRCYPCIGFLRIRTDDGSWLYLLRVRSDPASTSSTISAQPSHFDREFQIPVASWFHGLSWSRYPGSLSVCSSRLLLGRFHRPLPCQRRLPVNLLL